MHCGYAGTDEERAGCFALDGGVCLCSCNECLEELVRPLEGPPVDEAKVPPAPAAQKGDK